MNAAQEAIHHLQLSWCQWAPAFDRLGSCMWQCWGPACLQHVMIPAWGLWFRVQLDGGPQPLPLLHSASISLATDASLFDNFLSGTVLAGKGALCVSVSIQTMCLQKVLQGCRLSQQTSSKCFTSMFSLTVCKLWYRWGGWMTLKGHLNPFHALGHIPCLALLAVSSTYDILPSPLPNMDRMGNSGMAL